MHVYIEPFWHGGDLFVLHVYYDCIIFIVCCSSHSGMELISWPWYYDCIASYCVLSHLGMEVISWYYNYDQWFRQGGACGFICTSKRLPPRPLPVTSTGTIIIVIIMHEVEYIIL